MHFFKRIAKVIVYNERATLGELRTEMQVYGRRRRKTLAPGALAGEAATAAGAAASRFEVLVEDASHRESCASDVPFDAAMEVIGSSVVRRGRRTGEELAANFWADIGFPMPASRFCGRRLLQRSFVDLA
jgi:hypothetical protein